MTFDYIAEIGKKLIRSPLQVRVSRSWIAINSNNNAVMHRDFILIDEKGDDIWVQIPHRLMHNFSHLLTDQKVYTVTNAKVINAPKKFRPIPNRFAIEFTPTTVVEVIEDIPSIPQYKFSFLKAGKIPSALHKRELLTDVIGYVTEYKTPQNAPAYSAREEITLQMAKVFSVKVLVWGRLKTMMDGLYAANGDKPLVLIITSVFVRIFDSKDCLSTCGATQLLPNLQIPEVLEYITRANDDKLDAVLPVYSDPNDIGNSDSVTLETLNSKILEAENQEKYFIVDCMIKSIKDAWCYTGCEVCSKKVEDDVSDYFCCKLLRKDATKRFRVQIEVADNKGEADLILLDCFGQELLGTTANRLYELNGKDSKTPPDQITIFVGNNIKAQVQVNAYNIRTAKNEFTITKILASPIVQTPSTPQEKVPAFGTGDDSNQQSIKSWISGQSSIEKSAEVAASSTKNNEVAAINLDEALEDDLLDENDPSATINKDHKRKMVCVGSDDD